MSRTGMSNHTTWCCVASRGTLGAASTLSGLTAGAGRDGGGPPIVLGGSGFCAGAGPEADALTLATAGGLGLGRGKKLHDKRSALRERDVKREMDQDASYALKTGGGRRSRRDRDDW